MVAPLRTFTRLTISDQSLKQYLQPNGLSSPRNDAAIVLQHAVTDDIGPATRPISQKIHAGLDKGYCSFPALTRSYANHRLRFDQYSLARLHPFWVFFLSRSGRPSCRRSEFKSKARIGADQASTQGQGSQIRDVVPQTIHSSVRIFMTSALSYADVMELRNTEIIPQEHGGLSMGNR